MTADIFQFHNQTWTAKRTFSAKGMLFRDNLTTTVRATKRRPVCHREKYSASFYRFTLVNLIENQWVSWEWLGAQGGLAQSSLASKRTFAAKTMFFRYISIAMFRATNRRWGAIGKKSVNISVIFFSVFLFCLV